VGRDARRLIDVVLRGPAAVLPAGSPRFGNTMPAFGNASDATLARVLTYVRRTFGGGASAITTQEVTARRPR
jgi:hypothetical protein